MVINPTTPTQGHFVLSPVSLASRYQDDGPVELNDRHLRSHGKIGDCEQSKENVPRFLCQNSLETLSKPRRQRRRERHQTNGLMSRPTAVHVHYISLYISLLSSGNNNVKWLRSAYFGERERRRLIFRINFWIQLWHYTFSFSKFWEQYAQWTDLYSCEVNYSLVNYGRFPFDQIFRFEIPGIPCDEWNSIFRFLGLNSSQLNGHQVSSLAGKYKIQRRTLLPLFTCFQVARSTTLKLK